jgi:hypothetical protein
MSANIGRMVGWQARTMTRGDRHKAKGAVSLSEGGEVIVPILLAIAGLSW